MEPVIVDWGAAWVGGLVGTIAMTVFWYAMRTGGWMKLDLGQVLGTYFYPPGRRALAAGLSWHFMMGLLFGPVYALILASSGTSVNWLSGLVLGLLHAGVSVALLFPLVGMHPILAERSVPQLWTRADVALYALGFPIFGAFFGTTVNQYAGWVSATGTEPVRFWLTAFGVLAIALVIGLATYRLIPRWRAEQSPTFQAAMPDREERRQALLQAHESGRITEADLEAGLAELEEEDRV